MGVFVSPDSLLAEVTGADETVGTKLLFPLVSLSVAVILFEGGLTLRWNQIRDNSRALIRLITISATITWILTAVLAHYLTDFSWEGAWLVGAILIVTGPTVIGPLLRQIRPTKRVGSVLHWESILIDPIGAVAAVLVFGAISQPDESTAFNILASILSTLLVGITLGCGAAAVLVESLRRYWIPDFLHGVFFLVVVLATYVLSNLVREESGLVTVTALGIYLANQQSVSVSHVLEFKEHLRVLLISCLFILLGSRIQLADVSEIGWQGLLFVLLLVFVIRPISVLLGLIGTNWNIKEKLFVGLVAPRGIVAASVASIFGLKLASLDRFANIETASDPIATLTFLVILGTVTLSGLGAGPLARALGLSDVNPQGILFAGAARWVREVAAALKNNGVPVVLIDTNFGNITAARLSDLNATCGNVLSEHIRDELQLSGIGNLCAVTPSDEVNTLASLEYMHLFSRANVFQLSPSSRSHGRWQSIPKARRGRILFGNGVTYPRLEGLFESGGVVKVTTLTDNFTFADFLEQHGKETILLFAITRDGTLKIGTEDKMLEPSNKDRIVAVVCPESSRTGEAALQKITTDQSGTES